MDGTEHKLLLGCVESFSSSVNGSVEGLSFFLTLGNAINKVYTRVKINLSSWGKDYHTSELKSFQVDHQAQIASLFRSLPVIDDKLLVPVPEGMSKPYDITAKILIDALQELDVKSYTSSLLKYLKDLKSLDLADKGACASFIEKYKEFTLHSQKMEVQKTKTHLRECFSRSKLLYRPIKYAFSHTSIIKETYTTLLKCDKYFASAVVYKEDFFKTTSLIDECIHQFEAAQNVPSKLIQNVFTNLSVFTSLVDTYGRVLHDAQRVEHNYVSVLQTLLKVKNK